MIKIIISAFLFITVIFLYCAIYISSMIEKEQMSTHTQSTKISSNVKNKD